jgi:WD40 repeat protein
MNDKPVTHCVLGVSWKADGRMLVSSGADQAVKLWTFPAGEQTRTVQGFNKEVTSARFVGYGGEILTASGDTKVRLLKEDGSTARDFGGSKGFIFSTAITPDGQFILGGGQDSVLRIWNTASGKKRLQPQSAAHRFRSQKREPRSAKVKPPLCASAGRMHMRLRQLTWLVEGSAFQVTSSDNCDGETCGGNENEKKDPGGG